MTRRLAFVSMWDATNPNIESGYGYSMRRQLQRHFDVHDVFPLRLPGEKYWVPVRAGYRLIGQYYHPMREKSVLERLGRQIAGKLDEIAPDVVFAPSSLPLSYCKTEYPWIFSTDQLFGDFVASYIQNPASRFRKAGEEQERQALYAAAGAVFPSDQAARQAVDRYHTDPRKIAVIPWGANLPSVPPLTEIQRAIEARPLNPCHLVFIGRDWDRKGGPALVATVEELNRRGLQTRATIIGSDRSDLPPDTFEIHPFIDKRQPEQFQRLSDIMLSANFFFLPSRAEAFGQAFCEAAAFGIPLIGSRVGGIPTIIRDQVTGYLCPADTGADGFADIIENALADGGGYRRMAIAARQDFDERLNWDQFGNSLGAFIDTLIAPIR